MELWIRSVDKEILLKVNELEIETNMIIAFDGNKYQCLGTYKTKERALEVLDEIHQRLINLQCLELNGTDYITNSMRRQGIDCVYSMPKD